MTQLSLISVLLQIQTSLFLLTSRKRFCYQNETIFWYSPLLHASKFLCQWSYRIACAILSILGMYTRNTLHCLVNQLFNISFQAVLGKEICFFLRFTSEGRKYNNCRKIDRICIIPLRNTCLLKPSQECFYMCCLHFSVLKNSHFRFLQFEFLHGLCK